MALSTLIGQESKKWHYKDDERVEKVIINTEKLELYIKSRVSQTALEERLLYKYNHFKVIYEHDLTNSENQQELCSNIFRWLGLNDAVVKTSLTKTKGGNYSQQIENFEEVTEAIKRLSNWS